MTFPNLLIKQKTMSAISMRQALRVFWVGGVGACPRQHIIQTTNNLFQMYALHTYLTQFPVGLLP